MIKMDNTLQDSLKELTAYAMGEPHNIETRTYALDKAPNYSGEQIRLVREKLEMSRAVFADVLDVSPRTIERWEVDGAKPNGSAKRLIQLLDKNPQVIITMIKEASSTNEKTS